MWSRWENGHRQVPAERVLDIERLTGISRHDLRPDVFGPAEDRAA
jgi:DNA-binding transcriptional regulator YdaS (Cro superfamily)